MTLLVVKDDVCYVDSFTVLGDAEHHESKVYREGDVTYAVAGCAETGIKAVFELARRGWFETVETVSEDADHTFAVLRVAGRLYQLDLSVSKPRLHPIMRPNDLGLQVMAGSGWRFFHAYYLEHRDFTRALELAAQHCRDVAVPFEQF